VGGPHAGHRCAEPVLDDGPRRGHLRGREPALDRRRGSRLFPDRRDSVAARNASGSKVMITTRVKLDKISSSTRNAALASEVIVGEQIVAQEGYVLAVRIKEDKSSYNSVEDLAGRMVTLRAGDVLAGTLGTRRALRGYAGVVPAHISVGDTIDVLNLGCILGKCTSANPEIGAPFRAEVLGAILSFPELGDRVG